MKIEIYVDVDEGKGITKLSILDSGSVAKGSNRFRIVADLRTPAQNVKVEEIK